MSLTDHIYHRAAERRGDKFDRSMTRGKLLGNNVPLFIFISILIMTQLHPRYQKTMVADLCRCRVVAMSRCRVVALSRCRAVALSRCRDVALSRCRVVAMSRCRLPLSRCRVVDNETSQQREMAQISHHRKQTRELILKRRFSNKNVYIYFTNYKKKNSYNRLNGKAWLYIG